MTKRLYKSNNRVISGVCGGIGEYLNIDPTLVRILWVLGTFFTAFSGVIIYIIFACVMPMPPGVGDGYDQTHYTNQ